MSFNAIDTGLNDREGVLAFGNKDPKRNGFQWTLRRFPNAEHHHHNHNPSTDAAAHPVHRRLISPIKAVVQFLNQRIGIRARNISGIVRDHFPDSVYTQRDIYNARARISRENLGGYGFTAALIKLFDDKEIPYIAEWARDEPDRLVGFDNTYNTNGFKLPLFQITGQTCLGTIFNAAFGLIDNERLEGFQFLINGVRTLLNRYSIRPPDVIITDFDDQMKRALGVEFPDAQQQLCIYHINSNIILQSKRKWVYIIRDGSTGEKSSSDKPDTTLNQRDRQAVQAFGKEEETITHDNISRPITYDYHGVFIL
ncbi:hypothetical protein MKZ38_003084 [Zalerion maritima]|uniref:MULE transposase domain-containing protein n=1 Tax=Zalerion maritima TaxID=339359 RepID=A0AAD5WRZ8_9PEZI|nr:hypothetical protein MKZ38_003084 [Zalerion maritima]